MKIHKMEQQSEEWFSIKKGKMSASYAQQIGNCGKGLETYIMQIISDKFSTGEREDLISKDVERGNELEPIARGYYEMENGVEVMEVGFVEYNEYCGCSPDGLVGDDGGIEIKCPNDSNYFKILMTDQIDSKYMWQIQMNLLITGRKWWDFIAYNPNFKRLFYVKRVFPNMSMQSDLRSGISMGEDIMRKMISKYESIN